MDDPTGRATPLAHGLHALAAVLLLSACSGSGEADAFVFTAAGDYGFSEASSATLESIRSQGADFHLALGDLSYAPGRSETRWCDFVLERVGEGFPFQLAAGNHEDDFGGEGHVTRFAECLPDHMGVSGRYPQEYYFDHDGLARVIVISPDLTISGAHYYYGDDNEHYRWLGDVIDDARSRDIPWVVVGMHKTCVSLGPYYCDIYQDLFDLLIEKRVDLVLHGHSHSYQRTHQLATGGECAHVPIDDFDPACVAGPNGDGAYARAGGTVFAIVGTAGGGLYSLDEGDPEAGYFAEWMGANRSPRNGLLKLTVSPSAIIGEFLGSTTTSDFRDRFVIGGS